ncbi:MAG: stage III sporulation protein AF [Oscillospiraceae bacterium]|nr:stage III sporulation protein AF [Oscillospiraceae bacterium]
MQDFRQWAFSICCAALAGGMLRIILPESSVKKTFCVIISTFMVLSIVSPLKNFDKSFIKTELEISQQKENSHTYEFSDTAEEMFKNIACEKIKHLTKTKLEEMGIKTANISVYIDQPETQLQAKDIVIECILPESSNPRHDEICKLLEYELGTTIRIGYITDQTMAEG